MPSLRNFTNDDDDNHHEHLSRLWGNFIFIAIPFCCMIYLGVKLIRDNVRIIRERRERLNRNGMGMGMLMLMLMLMRMTRNNHETPAKKIENALTEFINENNSFVIKGTF